VFAQTTAVKTPNKTSVPPASTGTTAVKMQGKVSVPQTTVKTPTVKAQDKASVPLAEEDFYSSYIMYKLEVGTRMTRISLLDSSRGEPNNGSFMGTSTQLQESQNYFPAKLFAQYRITQQFGAGIGYDRFSFTVGDWGVEGAGTGGSDGKATLSGPLFYAMGRYPNSTKFTPFCELGLAFYSASFSADANWASTNDKGVSLGGTSGIYLAGGCAYEINEQFLVDLYMRYMKISDVNGEWVMLGSKQGDVVLTPSYFAIGIGAIFFF